MPSVDPGSWCMSRLQYERQAALQGSPAQEAIADREGAPAAAADEATCDEKTSSGPPAVGSKRGPIAALQEEAEDRVTPELAVGTPVGRSKLFPVFRRRGDYKVSTLCAVAISATAGNQRTSTDCKAALHASTRGGGNMVDGPWDCTRSPMS